MKLSTGRTLRSRHRFGRESQQVAHLRAKKCRPTSEKLQRPKIAVSLRLTPHTLTRNAAPSSPPTDAAPQEMRHFVSRQ